MYRVWCLLVGIPLLGLLAAGDVAGAAAGLRLSLDTPAAGTVVQPFTLAGWALDDSASAGTGVDAVHVWAWPSQGGAPIWIGDRYGGRRDDVAAVFGGRFVDSGCRPARTPSSCTPAAP